MMEMDKNAKENYCEKSLDLNNIQSVAVKKYEPIHKVDDTFPYFAFWFVTL